MEIKGEAALNYMSIINLINTFKGLYLLHFTNGACTIIHLHPDDQLVFGASRHLVEELQTLKLPLGVEGSRLQQS